MESVLRVVSTGFGGVPAHSPLPRTIEDSLAVDVDLFIEAVYLLICFLSWDNRYLLTMASCVYVYMVVVLFMKSQLFAKKKQCSHCVASFFLSPARPALGPF